MYGGHTGLSKDLPCTGYVGLPVRVPYWRAKMQTSKWKSIWKLGYLSVKELKIVGHAESIVHNKVPPLQKLSLNSVTARKS